MCEVYHFPLEMQPARPYPPPGDPRHQDVTDESVDRALEAANTERARINDLAGTQIPLHVRALRGEIPPDTCCACGCHIDLRPRQTAWPLGVLYGDPHLAVTRAVAHALETACGPAVEAFYDTLGADERLMLARQLSRVAVSAHIAEMAK